MDWKGKEKILIMSYMKLAREIFANIIIFSSMNLKVALISVFFSTAVDFILQVVE